MSQRLMSFLLEQRRTHQTHHIQPFAWCDSYWLLLHIREVSLEGQELFLLSHVVF